MRDIHASDNLVPALEIMNEWDDEGIDALVISGDITDGVRYYDTGVNEIKKVKNKNQKKSSNCKSVSSLLSKSL